jgi:hypothetical protein
VTHASKIARLTSGGISRGAFALGAGSVGAMVEKSHAAQPIPTITAETVTR